ncbi:hypothetical protein DAEQUDRAFT_295766 [Daedalea quercina L-15889]|uniref:Secreted protein n=1 Tax=Daedalea quercina L-15889 TaxID=1314783 RepID=A0A165U108_9APHY|nr:hypothetical protein DAEQUDRAFT_295766 [Daedalea quercina L-15889]
MNTMSLVSLLFSAVLRLWISSQWEGYPLDFAPGREPTTRPQAHCDCHVRGNTIHSLRNVRLTVSGPLCVTKRSQCRSL